MKQSDEASDVSESFGIKIQFQYKYQTNDKINYYL